MTAQDATPVASGPTAAQDGPQAAPARKRKASAPTVKRIVLAAGETVNAGTLAALIGDKAGAHQWALGRKVNDKRVRSVARESIERLMAENRTGYTAHAYSAAEADAIVAVMRSAGRGAPTVNANALRERASK